MKKFKEFITESITLGKEKLINWIKEDVEKYGSIITMVDLQTESDPVYRSTGDEVHLVSCLDNEGVDIIVFGGYKFQDEISEYHMNYEDLSWKLLKEILILLDTISNGLLELDSPIDKDEDSNYEEWVEE